MRPNLLRLEVFAHTEVPHVACVHRSLITDEDTRILPKVLALRLICLLLLLRLLVERTSPLSIQCQLKIVRIVEAMAQIFLDLLLDWTDGCESLGR